ncbi:nucleoside diphosphate-linked moiety X motif 6-like [Ylistrum balloti]|uniref:nucleoside diphosphate-linked moiety X motif 6-like n=1 Tax=Ylistrum balloti TaxID=509963 RepID=UPI002905EB29|nr:nucleoside diphosphate-linked moiety X motif 6-like [Ylistrum balloti]
MSGLAALWRRAICQRCWKLRHPPLRPLSSLMGETDRFNGITVDVKQVPESLPDKDFLDLLHNSLQIWKTEKITAAWLKVPIQYGRFIPIAARLGFQFHHAEGNSCHLKLWMKESSEDKTPRFATHQVGVAGFVFREDTQSVLVVKDRDRKFSFWKFAGGLSELGEDIGDTAVREVFEETGVKTEFQSVLSVRQQHTQPGAFGRSDFFFICRLTPLSYDIKPCSEEISACQWMNIHELHEGCKSVAPITRRILDLAMYGLKEGFHNVDLYAVDMQSVYKGLRYKLYHRPYPS